MKGGREGRACRKGERGQREGEKGRQREGERGRGRGRNREDRQR